MRLSITLLLLSALAVLLSVGFGLPQTDNALAATTPLSIINLAPATPALAQPTTQTDATLDVSSVPLTDIQQVNNTFPNATFPNATNPTNSTSSDTNTNTTDNNELSSLLASLDTSHLTPTQRTHIITAELNRMELVAGQQLTLPERERMAATMDAWLRLPADEKLAMIREQQAAYREAMRLEERRQLAELLRGMDEARQARDDAAAEADDGSVRRVRLVRVHPAHATAAAAEFAAAQMDPMADFAAQQMEMPYGFNIQQMHQHYQAW